MDSIQRRDENEKGMKAAVTDERRTASIPYKKVGVIGRCLVMRKCDVKSDVVVADEAEMWRTSRQSNMSMVDLHITPYESHIMALEVVSLHI